MDFRNWIQFELIITKGMLKGSRSLEQSVVDLLMLCFKQLPPSLFMAMEVALDFYAGGRLIEGNASNKACKPIYSFSHDAEAIYAAFLGQYGIDLQTVDLHWWQFKALFQGLNETNQIVKIMQYRAIDLSKIKDKEQKAFYRRMKALYKLPDMRSEEEKEQGIVDGLVGLF